MKSKATSFDSWISQTNKSSFIQSNNGLQKDRLDHQYEETQNVQSMTSI